MAVGCVSSALCGGAIALRRCPFLAFCFCYYKPKFCGYENCHTLWNFSTIIYVFVLLKLHNCLTLRERLQHRHRHCMRLVMRSIRLLVLSRYFHRLFVFLEDGRIFIAFFSEPKSNQPQEHIYCCRISTFWQLVNNWRANVEFIYFFISYCSKRNWILIGKYKQYLRTFSKKYLTTRDFKNTAANIF